MNKLIKCGLVGTAYNAQNFLYKRMSDVGIEFFLTDSKRLHGLSAMRINQKRNDVEICDVDVTKCVP